MLSATGSSSGIVPPSSWIVGSNSPRGVNPGAPTVSATPFLTSMQPSPWKPMTTSTSDARAPPAMENGMEANSGSLGPWVTMITSF